MFIYKVEDNKYFNIKELLKSYYEMSDKLISKLKRYKRIYKNDLPVYVTEKLSIGDVVKIDLIFEEESDNILPIKKDFSILYEDEYMLIVNKEPNFPVHPSSSHREDSLSIIEPSFLAIGAEIVPNKGEGMFSSIAKYSFLRIFFCICFIKHS